MLVKQCEFGDSHAFVYSECAENINARIVTAKSPLFIQEVPSCFVEVLKIGSRNC